MPLDDSATADLVVAKSFVIQDLVNAETGQRLKKQEPRRKVPSTEGEDKVGKTIMPGYSKERLAIVAL